MFCQKCGNPLPKEGFVCKFCGAMMTESQIEAQKNYMAQNKMPSKLKSEMYGIEKINYQNNSDDEKKSKKLGILLIGGMLIFLIILAIIIYIAR